MRVFLVAWSGPFDQVARASGGRPAPGSERSVVLRFVQGEELGKLRQPVQALGRLPALHPAHGEVHPRERAADQGEEQHEAARPHPDEIVHHPEADRQDEASEAADHPDEAADRAHVLGIVDGDVLVDRRLAERHREAEDDRQRDEESAGRW